MRELAEALKREASEEARLRLQQVAEEAAAQREAEEAAARQQAEEVELQVASRLAEVRAMEAQSAAERERLAREGEELRRRTQAEAEEAWRRAEAARAAQLSREVEASRDAGPLELTLARRKLKSTAWLPQAEKLPAPLPPPAPSWYTQPGLRSRQRRSLLTSPPSAALHAERANSISSSVCSRPVGGCVWSQPSGPQTSHAPDTHPLTHPLSHTHSLTRSLTSLTHLNDSSRSLTLSL